MRKKKQSKKQNQVLDAKLIVGLDFGTTFTKVSFVNPLGIPEVVRSNGKDLLVRTAMLFLLDRIEYGNRAENSRLLDSPKTPFYDEFKRLLGQVGDDGKPPILFIHPGTGQSITVVDLLQMFFEHVLDSVEKEVQGKIGGMVVTVPAYFKDLARQQVRDAAERTGRKVLQLLQEPVAAGLSYLTESAEPGLYMTYDLGGGTFDVTVLDYDGKEIKVKAVDGHSKLGGCDFDMAIREMVLAELQKEHGFAPDSADDAQDLQEFMARITTARHDLSETEVVTLVARVRTAQYQRELRREEFNRLIEPDIDETILTSKRCLVKANIEARELTGIILVGAPTRTPFVEEKVRQALDCPVLAAQDREFCVAKGAAIRAVQLARADSDKELSDAAYEIPVTEVQLKAKTAHALCIGVVDPTDPDRKRHVHHVMIPEQSDIPRTFPDRFTPVRDYATGVEIPITQGEEGAPVTPESVMKTLRLSIKPLPKAERLNSIEVTYSFDEDALIKAHAKDLIGGNEVDAEVAAPSALQQVQE